MGRSVPDSSRRCSSFLVLLQVVLVEKVVIIQVVSLVVVLVQDLLEDFLCLMENKH